MIYQKVLSFEVEKFLENLEDRDKQEKKAKISSKIAIDIVPRIVGQFIYQQIRIRKPKVILEIGTGHGYCTIWMAKASQEYNPNAKIFTIEIIPERKESAERNFSALHLKESITSILGDARVAWNFTPKPIDFVFIDADFAAYRHYLEQIWPHLALDGIIYAYNITKKENALMDFLDRAKTMKNTLSISLSIANGIESVLKINK